MENYNEQEFSDSSLNLSLGDNNKIIIEPLVNISEKCESYKLSEKEKNDYLKHLLYSPTLINYSRNSIVDGEILSTTNQTDDNESVGSSNRNIDTYQKSVIKFPGQGEKGYTLRVFTIWKKIEEELNLFERYKIKWHLIILITWLNIIPLFLFYFFGSKLQINNKLMFSIFGGILYLLEVIF